jgi:predicted small lipoprotein YifL
MPPRIRIAAVTIAAAFALAACGKKEPPAAPPAPAPASAPVPAPAPAPAPVGVTVSSVALGKSVGADKKVSVPAEVFAKGDTIHASIDTATVQARWTFTKDGKTVPVKEESATISATGPSTTEFHISKPDGWPVGSYAVEILVDGKTAASKTFSVQ